MPLVAPLVAVGVALLLLLVAYAFAVIVTPILEGMAKKVPVVGGYIARGIDAAVQWAYDKTLGYVTSGLAMLVRWFRGLVDSVRDFADAVNAFVVHLPDVLAELLHVNVHEIVHAFVNPVRDLARSAQRDADAALGAIDDLATRPLSTFRGIEHGVDAALDRLQELVENVDLPELHDVLDREIGRARDALDGQIGDLADVVAGDVAAVWGWVDSMPWQDLLALLSSVPALALLVRTITAEAGLDEAECRAKFRHVCGADPLAWAALLDIAGAALLWGGVEEFVRLAQDFAGETLPVIIGAVRGG